MTQTYVELEAERLQSLPQAKRYDASGNEDANGAFVRLEDHQKALQNAYNAGGHWALVDEGYAWADFEPEPLYDT